MTEDAAHNSSSTELRRLEERDGVDPGEYTVLNECPVGKAIRETPQVYDALNAGVYVETGAINPSDESPWFARMHTIGASERLRHMHHKHDKAQQERQAKSDSEYGKRVRRGW